MLEAESGKDGVTRFESSNPDLVITDMLMPDKEGLETIADIRKVNPKARVLAMSGGGNTGNMTFLEMARKVGADQVIRKPLKPELFISTVNDLLGR